MGDEADGPEDSSRWPLLGFAGAVSLCCVFAAPSATGAVGGAAAGGTAAATGADLIQIAVAALTVGVMLFVLRRRTGSTTSESE